MKRVLAVVVAALALMPTPARPADSSKDMKVQLPLTDGTYVSGTLESVDDQNITLKVGGESRQIPLEQVKPIGVYLAKKRIMRDDDARAHMQLGRFLLKHGEEGIARKELLKAVRIDPSLKEEAQKLLESGGASEPKGPQDEGPPKQAKPQPPKEQQAEKGKYAKATPAEIAATTKKADEYAAKAKTFAPALHLVESEHFRIFSAWPASRDGGLASVAEKMYRACCQQFEIDPKENIFAGKCPIYVFWEKKQFEEFSEAIGNSGHVKAAGYAGAGGGGFVYIVMNANRNYAPFCEILVHEGTHAFINRYTAMAHVPTWVHEGMADLVVSTVLTRSWAARKHRAAAMRAMRQNADIRHIFRTVRLDDYDYGLAQSLVRFMIIKDRRAFANFIELLKKRKSETEALQEAFGWTHDELVKNWKAAVPSMYGR